MLEIIIGTIAGVAIGLTTSLIPGLGPMQSLWGASALTFIMPSAVPAAILSAFITSQFLGSAKEAISPELSASPEAIYAAEDEVNENVDPWHLTQQIFNAKWIGLFAGALLAIAFGSFAQWGSVPGTLLIVVVLVIKRWNEIQQEWPLVVGYLLLMKLFFWVYPFIGITQPVYALGLVIFVIPGCLRRPTKIVSEGESPNLTPNPASLLLASLVSMLTPGVNPNGLLTTVTDKFNGRLQTTALAAEMLMESFGLLMLLQGVNNGKTALGMELTQQVINPVLVLISMALPFALMLLIRGVFVRYYQIVAIPRIRSAWALIAIAFAVINLLIICGLWAALLIPAGLLIDRLASDCKLINVRSFTFLAPVL